MKSGNRYLARIYRTTGEKEPSAAIAAFVRKKRTASEPLDLLAIRLGVTRISEESLAFEGGVFKLPSGELVIKLKTDSPPSRKQFTLAHEIGHLMLGEPGLRSSCGGDRDLERTCDAIAGELLMPAEDATMFVQSLGQPSPEKLKIIASKYGVSVHAAAVRVQSGR